MPPRRGVRVDGDVARWNEDCTMRRCIVLIVCLLLLSIPLQAELTLPGDGFSGGWVRSGEPMHFVGLNLFDHIDGGAELFHEFGFKELIVQEYVKGEEEIDLEVYQMDGPAPALGLYLMKCGRETPTEGLSVRHSANKYQFTIVKNASYIQVNSFSGDTTLIPVMVALSKQVLESIPEGEPVTLFELLPSENLIDGSARLIRGQYGLQPIFTLGSGDILKLGGKIFGVVGGYSLNEENAYTQIIIPYPSKEEAAAAFVNLAENLDSYLTMQAKNDAGFIFKDHKERFGIVKIDKDLLTIKVNLPEKPVL
ncbi:MAG: hypothetical protein KJ970_11605 [Candidatus Eisenbacteria bacterium]|uniref:Uncharacterized protein n=1 Tax=Eiseniibacteriota bacterium TaxID=2212470 RepID=A0A948RV40_UNCEI|nr:hypothetical protein [Candidatus Eisenbacteria bacterium]MBU1948872.1 hypothetical protein [Candidatus Eisenbacteria bacterium]MBU2691563.1 hypothetical protein [Candidatus Eisenbacteria bacterium]